MKPKFVLVTDSGMLKPTLFTAWGVLRHLSGEGELHFWGDRLSEEAWGMVDQLSRVNPNVEVRKLKLSAADFDGAKGVSDHISVATMGRLHIPSKLSGRVLYLDGDIQVTGDLRPLFLAPMGGKPVGAVRDFVVSRSCVKKTLDKPKYAARTNEIRELMLREEVSEYFNAGVLLLDADMIRRTPDLSARMGDVVRASSWPLGDQDHLNNIFVGNVHFLNPAWNSSWSRAAEQRSFARVFGGGSQETESLPTAVVHFHGPKKPWKIRRKNFWRRPTRAAIAYRMEMRSYGRSFPELAF